MRQKSEFGHDEMSRVKYYGVNILWTNFIIEVGILRWAAGFTTTDSQQQSNLFRLEHVIEETLNEVSKNVADDCMQWLKLFRGFTKDYLIQFFDEITYRFLFDTSIHSRRINRLPAALIMTWELTDEYKSFKADLMKIAKEKNCEPRELVDLSERPRFYW